MRVYWLVALLAFLVQFIPVKSGKQYWWRTVISFIPLFLFMALREEYGIDEKGYHDYFEMVKRSSDIFNVNNHMEYGYALLNKILPSYQSLVVLSSLLTCLAYSSLIYRYVPHRYSWLAVSLLFLSPSLAVYFMMSGIRNGIAVSLLILSCYYIETRKLVPYVCMGLIATTIHTSAALIFFLCYILGTNQPITKAKMYIWIGVMIAFSLASLSKIVDTTLPFLSYFTDRYDSQVIEIAETADERGLTAAIVGISFAAGILFFVFSIQRNRLDLRTGQNVNNNFFLFKMALLFTASFTLGSISARTAQYLIYYFIIVVTIMFAKWENRLLKYGYLLAVLLFFRFTLISWLNNPYFIYDIYKSVLGDF